MQAMLKFSVLLLSVMVSTFTYCQQTVVNKSSLNPLVARVFGQDIYLSTLDPADDELDKYMRISQHKTLWEVKTKLRQSKLSNLIWSPIYNELESQFDVEPNSQEVNSFMEVMDRLSPPSDSLDIPPLSDVEQQQVYDFYASIVKNWKVGKLLYETYGGEVIFQQGNPMEPVGAYRKLLEEHRAKGDFIIFDAQMKEAFWHYYVRKHPGQLNQEEIDFSTPWWKKIDTSSSH